MTNFSDMLSKAKDMQEKMRGQDKIKKLKSKEFLEAVLSKLLYQEIMNLNQLKLLKQPKKKVKKLLMI